MSMAKGNDEQHCPQCGNRKLDIQTTKSRTGTTQSALYCQTHGRKTPQYATATLAAAGVVNKTLGIQ
jgi:hypothetical protein